MYIKYTLFVATNNLLYLKLQKKKISLLCLKFKCTKYNIKTYVLSFDVFLNDCI